MQACIYYLASEVYRERDAARMINKIEYLIGGAGLTMLTVFGLLFAQRPEDATLYKTGWLLIYLGILLTVGSIISLVIRHVRKKSGFRFVLKKGSIHEATVLEYSTNEAMVREMKYHKAIVENGVPMFDRQWVMQTFITISIENTRIKFATFRPEIISIFKTGSKIPVLWHRKRPKFFIPVEMQ